MLDSHARPRFVVVVVALVLGCRAEEGLTKGLTTGDTSVAGESEGTGTAVTGSASTASSTASPTIGGVDLPPARACNGDSALCERRFDQVVFPCAHNAFAARDDGFQKINANQRHGVAQQLADGVRCLMLDVSDDSGTTVLCHGGCALGRVAHAEVLADIAAFLADNPDEVLTIIYQDDLPVDRIVGDLEAAGVAKLTYSHEAGAAWPTLASMIDADTRLIVTAEVGGPPPAWFHHVWDLAWDTPYTFHGVDEFNCELNRGSVDNDLFLVNHWVSTVLDTPSEADAAAANSYDVLYGRAIECQRSAAQVPNFVAVDFYDTGDLFAVVRALNGLP